MTPPTSPKIMSGQVDGQTLNREDLDRFHSRKNPRLRNYDYSMPNCYFITICAWNKECLFGGPEKLNAYGRIAEQGLLELEKHFENVTVDKYVVMPNHVHAILTLREQKTNVSVVVGLYKSYVTKQIHSVEPKRKVWQTSFHDHIIRDEKGYQRIWSYIDANPANWTKDCFFEDRIQYFNL